MKRTVSLLIAVLMLLNLPLCGAVSSPSLFGDLSFTASAVSSYDTLVELFNSIPERGTWASTYVDATNLSYWYNQAEMVIENPEGYTEGYVANVLKGLSDAYGALQYRTTSLSIDKSSLSLKIGASATLKATVTPSNAADPVKWKSSDPSFVTVSDKGVVKAVKYTKSVITITATSNGHSDTCKVTVTNPIDKLTLNTDTKVTYKGMSFTLTPTAKGLDSSSPISYSVVYTWDTSNEKVCTVNEDGKVTAVGTGTATIICSAKAGVTKTAICTVSVNNLIEITGFIPQFTTVDGAVTLIVGETETLSVNITPETATLKLLNWTSSDPSVLKVLSSGTSSSTSTARVQALKTGTVSLTYKATDGSGKSGKLTVNVKPQISKLEVSPSRAIITPGNSKTLTTEITPKSAGNQVLEFSSSDTNVASVNSSGKISANNKGTCVITVKTTDGSNLTETCSIRVAPSAKSIKLSKTVAAVNAGSKITIVPTVTTSVDTTYNDFVSFSSSDTSIAKVSSDGKVTGIAPGIATITATTMDGTKLTATAIVRVLQPVTGVSCTEKKTIEKNSSFTLKVTVSPSDATNKSVTFSSSDTSIATVNSDGVVRSLSKEGVCTITVKTVDGDFKAKCIVSVETATTGIKLNTSKKTIEAGKSFTLSATVSPANATNKTVTWKTSDKKVATVSDGTVTAVAGGTCTITAKASGGQTAECIVSVTQGIETLTLKKTSLNLYKGQVYTLNKVVTPKTSTVTAFSWKSTDTAVATVNSNGKITAKGIGTCTISVTADGKSASCVVKVTEVVKATGLSLEPREVSVASGKTATVKAVFTPKNTSVKTVKWTSSNNAIATVSDKGVITGVSSGSCIVTAKSDDGGFVARCTVNVNIPVTGLRFKEENVYCNLNGTLKLSCTIYPTNASDKTLVWTSSNEKVATVSSTGVVSGIKSGKTTVTASTPDGKLSAKVVVNVLLKVTGVKLDKSKLTLEKGTTYCLVYAVQPKNATNKKVTWKSNNPAVATVEDGVITALKTGNAIITVKTKESGYTATCTVKVIQPVTAVKLQYTSMTINVGVSKTVSATVRPITATSKKVVWSSSDKSIAKVSKTGKITAIAPGSCIITCKSEDGYAKATLKLKVVQPPKGIKLSATSLNIPIKDSAQLTATVKPKNTSNKTVIWVTNNNAVATVDASGKVTAVGLGSCTISAKTSDGKYTANCKVLVYTPVKSITLNVQSASVEVGDQIVLMPTIKPAKATFKTVKWSSNNKDVAVVDKDGIITALSPGYAVITAKSKDGAKKATCRINVIQPATGIKINKTSVELDIDETLKLKATVKPSNVSNPAVKWSSSNKNVVKVKADGTLVGVGFGTATVTARSVDGGFKAKCTVTVLNKVHEISLSTKKITAYVGQPFTLKATVLPANATNKKVTWSSSDQSVCLVSAKGKVTPVKAGKANIIVTSVQGGIKVKCVVTVEYPATKIDLSSTAETLNVGNSIELIATVLPENTTNKTVTWSSSDDSIASVSSKGVVTAKSSGTVTITATSSNGVAKTCTITVTE